ncbi:acyl carrier protein, partial [Paenibacillus maysiensis]|uniref:acyl carrier protein n=1 Tax=Paenibacillus maysiensis TaxID=1155954 RepID=UPI0012DCBCFE
AYKHEGASGEVAPAAGSLINPIAPEGTRTADPAERLQEKTVHYFKKLLSDITKLPAERIEEKAPLEKYGIDSIMVMQLTVRLEQDFGPLSKTLFFEYQTLRELCGYFM